MRRLLRLLAAVALLPMRAAAQDGATPETERLVRLCSVWSAVKFAHPWLGYKDIDWDGALVRAVARVRTAGSDRETAEAVGAMLDELHDPATRVFDAGAFAPPSPAVEVTLWRWLPHDDLLIAAGPFIAARGVGAFHAARDDVGKEIARAKSVIVDLRAPERFRFTVASAVDGLPGLSQEEVRAPATRTTFHSGYRTQRDEGSASYFSGFLSTPGRVFPAADRAAPSGVAFLVGGSTLLPNVAAALRLSGRALFVAEQQLSDAAFVPVRYLALGTGWMASVRIAEVEVVGAIVADAVAPPREGRDSTLERAVRMLRKKARPMRAANTCLPSYVWRPDRDYPEMAYPDVGHRLLAAFRIFSVIDHFYPYKHLIGDWDAVLPQSIPRFVAAKNADEYLEVVMEMAARVEDTHTRVPTAVDRRFGVARVPIEVRVVEGRPVVTRIASEPPVGESIHVGDVLLSIEGEPFDVRMERLQKYVAGSTRVGRRSQAASLALRMRQEGVVNLEVEGADGHVRAVPVVAARAPVFAPADQGTPYKILDGGVGYVDMKRLEARETDAMFEALGRTRAIVFDMRGYPRGAGFAIAPRINVRGASAGASFRRRQYANIVGAPMEAGYYFEQAIPPTSKSKYTGRTVMLIDDRTSSQAEHTGLFFEAAGGTEFIGTESAGANGDVTVLVLPGGLAMRFSGHDVRHADGRQLQRVGLVPRIRVDPTIAGIRAGRDEVLERAIEHLKAAAE